MVPVIIFIFERKGLTRTLVTRAHTFSQEDIKRMKKFGWTVKSYISQVAGSPADIKEFIETAR